MIISYSGQGVAFDNIVINNINTQPVPGGNAAELTGGTLQELAETLPDTAWTISFESSTTPEKNFNHVVTVEWVAKIKAWMISQS